MPVISCTKCLGKMRFPDDSPARRVKCPTCGHTFLSSEGDAGSPKKESERSGRDSRSEVGDRSRSRDDDDRGSRRRDNDDDDRRSRRRDEGDDDRDRGRRRRDDDDDDRDRSRRRRDDDDDDRRSRRRDDDDRGSRGRYDRTENNPRIQDARFGRASLGCLLCFIGGWFGFGTLCVLAFGHFLSLCGVGENWNLVLLIAGILGLAHWLTSGTGIGFMIAGPRNHGALGLSIATAGVAGFHFMLLIVLAASQSRGLFQSSPLWAFKGQSEHLPNVLYFTLTDRSILISVLAVFANLAEIARFVLLLLTYRAYMICAKDTRGTRLATRTMIGFAIGCGALIIAGIFFGVIQSAIAPSRGFDSKAVENQRTIDFLYFMTISLGMAGLLIWTTLVTKIIKGNIDYRRD